MIISAAWILVSACAWDYGLIPASVAAAIVAAAIVLPRHTLRARLCLAAVFACGLAFSRYASWVALTETWSTGAGEIEARVVLRVLETPRVQSFGATVLATTTAGGLPARLRVRWPVAESLFRGQCWRVSLRVAPMPERRSTHRQRSDLVLGVGAYASVLGAPQRVRCASRMQWLDAWRNTLRTQIHRTVTDAPTRAVALALALGERHELSDDQRHALQRTGLAHLMAISGLHVGLAATFGFWLGRLVPVPTFMVRQDVGWCGALACAALYAMLSGLAVPAQRALIATALLAFSHWQRVRIRLGRLLALGALVVVVMEPATVLSASFLMSFSAVALLAVHQARQRWRWRGAGKRRNLLFAQALLSVVLGTLAASQFGTLSLLSLGANLALIPWFAFVVVPSILVGCGLALLSAALGALGWQWVAATLQPALILVDRLSALSWSAITVGQLHPMVWLLIVAAMLWSLLGWGVAGRWIASIAVVLVVAIRASPPPPGCLDLRAHSVGHGLAVSLRTRGRVTLVDAGPAWAGGDAGTRVLLPYLRAAGVDRIDHAIVSHSDNDHAGGFDALRKGVRVEHWLGTPSWPCLAGQRWQRDGVRYEVLWPVAQFRNWSDNDRSCVLRITTGRGAVVLLPGDIEERAERALLLMASVSSDIVLVPHHGSRTSSSEAWVRGTGAHAAWVSNASRRGWQMPHPSVRARWEAAGAEVRETAKEGALEARICAPFVVGRRRAR